MVKHIHSSTVGRPENCNLLIAHIQYIGPDSMASQYAYTITLFDADRRKDGPKFEGVVSSTLKPLESQVSKVNQLGVLNLIVQFYQTIFRRTRSLWLLSTQPGTTQTSSPTWTSSSTWSRWRRRRRRRRRSRARAAANHLHGQQSLWQGPVRPRPSIRWLALVRVLATSHRLVTMAVKWLGLFWPCAHTLHTLPQLFQSTLDFP